jgi:transcriptional regulator with XRE-family HTH domain
VAQRRSLKTERDLVRFGDNLLRWRKLHGLTAQLVAERAGVTRATLRSIERGEGTARLENVFAVLRVLGQSEAVIAATEPMNTDLGRANAGELLPQRVRLR